MNIKKLKAGRKPYYDQSIKNTICFEILRGNLSMSEAKARYAIKGDGTIYRWLMEYKENELEITLHSMNSTDPTPQNVNADQEGNTEDLQKKNQELEAALKMARLKITALETMIDIAESELNIDIRKKSGTKQ
jgi:transposase-like protein